MIRRLVTTSKSEFSLLFKILLKSINFDCNKHHKICTLAASAHSIVNMVPVDISLLYEDDFIIVADKPSNILAVPGKSAKPFVKFRHDQWQDAVLLASGGKFCTVDSECQKYLTLLADMSSIPRKEARFYGFIAKTLKIIDIPMQKLIWKLINDADISLNKQPFAEIPSHLVSVADLLEKHCGHKIYTVHRLDMETSGVIIFAKTENSSAELARQFRDREIEKIYYAKVAHRVHVPFQTVCVSIRPDLNNRPFQVIDALHGKESVTHVKVVNCVECEDVSAVDSGHESSYVKLIPVTGRSHQLRVHLAHIGHPILGDTLYAPPDVVSMSPRLCLHAQFLKFAHPATNQITVIESKCCDFFPKDLVTEGFV